MKSASISSTAGAIIISFLFWACDSKIIHKQYDDDFPQNQWVKTDIRSYEFEIPTEGSYDLAIMFSHVYDTPLENIPVMVHFETPSGEIEKSNVMMRLRGESGRHVGDCAGDYCDTEHSVFTKRKLPAGKYKVSLANQFDYKFMPNVIGVGIKVTASGNQ